METDKRNSATSAITSGPVWTWKHEGAGKKQQQKHATIHTTLTTSGANVQQKKVLKVLAWFFLRWRPFYRGCNGGEMNWIVICYSETLFWMGTFIVKRLLRGGQFVLFLNMPPKGPTATAGPVPWCRAQRETVATQRTGSTISIVHGHTQGACEIRTHPNPREHVTSWWNWFWLQKEGVLEMRFFSVLDVINYVCHTKGACEIPTNPNPGENFTWWWNCLWVIPRVSELI